MDNIDPDLKYCLRCRDEYRADFEYCASCGDALMSGAQLLESAAGRAQNGGNRKPVIGDEDDVVPLCGGSLLDMKRLKNELAGRGIPTVLASEDGCRSGCRGPQVQLYIRPGDAQMAAAVLHEEHIRTTARHEFDDVSAEAVFDPAGEQVSCPACGTTFTPEGGACPECGLQFL